MKEEPASESAAAPVPTASRIWRSRSAWLIATDAAPATAGAISGRRHRRAIYAVVGNGGK